MPKTLKELAAEVPPEKRAEYMKKMLEKMENDPELRDWVKTIMKGPRDAAS